MPELPSDTALVDGVSVGVSVGDGAVLSVGAVLGVSVGVGTSVAGAVGVACAWALFEQLGLGDGRADPVWPPLGTMPVGAVCPLRVGPRPPPPGLLGPWLAGVPLGKKSSTRVSRTWARPYTPATTITTAPATARAGRSQPRLEPPRGLRCVAGPVPGRVRDGLTRATMLATVELSRPTNASHGPPRSATVVRRPVYVGSSRIMISRARSAHSVSISDACRTSHGACVRWRIRSRPPCRARWNPPP